MKKLFFTLLFINIFLSHSQTPSIGLIQNDSGSFNGYTLFSPNSYSESYLIDNCGNEINRWQGSASPRLMAYLLENGDLLRSANFNNPIYSGTGGSGGKLERFDWDGNLLWSFIYSDSIKQQHHDFEILPNGNILILAWEYKTATEAIAHGRNPAMVSTSLWPDHIVEIEPTGTTGGNIVWEWHAWDHLIQDFDSTKFNYGVVADHPELININFTSSSNPDWLHSNSVDYNESLDQIILSIHNFSEIWIIDHSTTSTEAAGHNGGNSGKGGDILYRWGNPRAYQRGNNTDQKLWGQHDAHWIEPGLVDSGKIMIFNNGIGRTGGNYSSVDIIDPPTDSSGNYYLASLSAYGPDTLSWQYVASPPSSFYSSNISGAQRIEKGNTLICEGSSGNIFEIDSSKNMVWNYINPVNQSGPMNQGSNPNGNALFRALRYSPAYAGFTGRSLSPGNRIELNPYPSTCSVITMTDHDLVDWHSNILIYPNPFNSFIIIKNMPEENLIITISDLKGIINQKKYSNLLQTELSTKELKQGIYIIKIESSHSSSVTRLIKL